MKKLDPKAVWLFFLQFVLGLVSFYILMLIFVVPYFISTFIGAASRTSAYSSSTFLAIILIAICSIIPFAALAYLFAKLSYNNYFYELREDGFRMEYGVINKKYITIPYERIQNIDIYRNLLARIIGLSDLQIQTAGMSAAMPYGRRGGIYGAGSEGRLPGLNPQVAEEVRNELLKKAKGAKAVI